jgi:hypothetical protein
MKLTNLIILILANLFFSIVSVHSQAKFDVEHLAHPKKYGPGIADGLKTIEVYEFDTTANSGHCCLLKNGLRSSDYVNINEWLAIKDNVTPYRIDLVYSKYPLVNTSYREIYPLLCNRLINLFKTSPELNDFDLEWNKVWQTHCEHDDQVNALFHGVVIWYHKETDQDESNTSELDEEEEAIQQGAQNDLVKNLEDIKKSTLLPDSIKEKIKYLPLDQQTTVVQNYLVDRMNLLNNVKLSEATGQEIKTLKEKVREFVQSHRASDQTVSKILDRHPEWKKILVINDWTGSL